jgi:ATP-dependent Clp protease ATP-binding subunit ClpC
MLLQIFDDGHLSDAKGRKVDFRNTIVIMTSNVGSDLIRKDSRVGFATTVDEDKTAEDRYRRMKDRVEEEMKRVFRPEFLNRIDQHVVFHALGPDHIRQIVDLQLNDLRKNLREKSMHLEVTSELLDYLGKEGFDQVFGARPLRRVIQNQVEDPLSDSMLDSTYREGDTIRIDYVDSQIKIDRIERAAEPPEPLEPAEPALTS